MRVARFAGGLAWYLVAGIAMGADRPIAGTRLVLERTHAGARTLRFVSRDPAFLFPAVGSVDDPTIAGATIDVFSASEGSAAIDIPSGLGMPGWHVLTSKTPTYVYANHDAPAGPSAVRSAVIKRSRTLRMAVQDVQLPMIAALGTVGIRITTGTLRSCALFGAPTIRRDVPGAFVAKGATAVGLVDCSTLALGGITTTTTTTTTTSTTTTTNCGDGVVDPGEQCDTAGSVYGTSPCGGFFCALPGFSNGCHCCTNGPNSCCDPSAYFDPWRDSGECVSTRCDPPFTCGIGVCQPDHTCCSPNGGGCVILEGQPFDPFIVVSPCCPGQECRSEGPNPNGNRSCCTADGGSCSADTECCAAHCTGGTCAACITNGASCSEDQECCSRRCDGGVCACRPNGYPCAVASECCGTRCDPFDGCH